MSAPKGQEPVATVEAPEEVLDGDGYPTEEALAYLDAFPGTVAQLLEYLEQLLAGYGSMQTAQITDHRGHTLTEARITTGGWSGCEEVVSHLSHTMFHASYWESSHRGGLTVYRIPPGMDDVAGLWGNAAA